MNTLSNMLAAVALSLVVGATPALAGRGGSAAAIDAAVASGSVDAIVAEVERTEKLICEACLDTMIGLTADPRPRVREVAAWWFAKRPGTKNILIAQFEQELASADPVAVRNAADFLGHVRALGALPKLSVALARGELDPEARVAVVQAVGAIAHRDGNPILTRAFADASPAVRVAAVVAWRDVLGQATAAPLASLLADPDAGVRAEAATVLGAFGEGTARLALEALVVADPSATVRRNAAWALGRIGAPESTLALTAATMDRSGIVRGVARGVLAARAPR